MCKIVCGGQSGRSGTDNGHFLFPLFGHLRDVRLPRVAFIVGQKPVQFPDGQGLIQIVSRTYLFTRMMAYAAADPGEGMVLFEKFERFPVFSRVDECDIPLNAHMGRARRLTGGGAPLVDGIRAGYCLGILLVDGFLG